MIDLAFLARVKRIDAAVLFAFINERLGGRVSESSYEKLAIQLNEHQLTTGRGSNWTAAVVRAAIKRLEEVNAIVKETLSSALFSIECERSEDARYENENENDNEGTAGKEALTRARVKEDININTKNKQTNFKSSSIEDSSADSTTVDDVVANVDFTDEKVKRLRSQIVKAVYEPGVHSDLIDRAVSAIVRRIATTKDLKAAIAEAKDEQRLLSSTNGFRGKRKLWQTFCLRVKDWFDSLGIRWTKTSPRLEPAPASTIAVNSDADADRIVAMSDALRKSAPKLTPMRRGVVPC